MLFCYFVIIVIEKVLGRSLLSKSPAMERRGPRQKEMDGALVCFFIHIHICIYIYMYVHVCIYIYIYILVIKLFGINNYIV